MKTIRSRILGGLAAGLLIGMVAGQPAVAMLEGPMATWEMTTVGVLWDPAADAAEAYYLEGDPSVRSPTIAGILNPYGAAGWELVNVWPETTITRSGIEPFPEPQTFVVEWQAAFKRPLAAPPLAE